MTLGDKIIASLERQKNDVLKEMEQLHVDCEGTYPDPSDCLEKLNLLYFDLNRIEFEIRLIKRRTDS